MLFWHKIWLPFIPASTQRWNDVELTSVRPSGGGRVVLPVPGRPTIWITVGQGPTALAVGAGWGCLDIFTLIYPLSPLPPSLWETARYRLKYCLKEPLNPKQPTSSTIDVSTTSFRRYALARKTKPIISSRLIFLPWSMSEWRSRCLSSVCSSHYLSLFYILCRFDYMLVCPCVRARTLNTTIFNLLLFQWIGILITVKSGSRLFAQKYFPSYL